MAIFTENAIRSSEIDASLKFLIVNLQRKDIVFSKRVLI